MHLLEGMGAQVYKRSCTWQNAKISICLWKEIGV